MSDPEDPQLPPASDPAEPPDRWGKWERWGTGELERGGGEPVEPPPSRGVPWRAREGLAIFVLHLLGAALLTLPVAFLTRNEDTVIAIAILLTEITLLATTLLWVGARYGMGPRGLGVRGLSGLNVLIGLGAAVGGLILATIIGGILYTIVEKVTGSPVGEPQQIPIDEPAGGLLWIIGISVVLLAPVAEEVFFRGFVYTGLRRWARPWPAVLISAAFFAAAHFDWRVIPPIFGLGIVLAWIVEQRRSLVPAIVAHMAFNLFGFVLMFVLTDPAVEALRAP